GVKHFIHIALLLFFFAWLVYMLNAVKGQGYIGNIFFSSVPEKKYIFFICKKFVNEFLWQFFTCLYQFNDSVFICIVQIHQLSIGLFTVKPGMWSKSPVFLVIISVQYNNAVAAIIASADFIFLCCFSSVALSITSLVIGKMVTNENTALKYSSASSVKP